MSSERKRDVIARYYQLSFSGESHSVQPGNKDSDNNENVKDTPPKSDKFWKQKSYRVLVPIVITETSTTGNEYGYSIQIPDNLDLSISPNSKKGKGPSKEVFNLAPEKQRDNRKISVVYGVHEDGQYTLSPASEHSISQVVSFLYGSILGKAHRAIECILLHSKGETSGVENPDQRIQSPLSQENVGKPKARRRSKKIRTKIHSKAIPENPSEMDEPNREILGVRPSNKPDKLEQMGDNSGDGWTIETVPF